jgi:excisionase family DNA binding protein
VSGSPYLVDVHGPAVVVPARVCALVEARCDLSGLRVRVRGVDPEASNVLIALHIAALTFRTSATGSPVAATREAPAEWLSTAQAAAVASVTPRAVRLAAREGRLQAVKVGKAWRVSRESLAHWEAARRAA